MVRTDGCQCYVKTLGAEAMLSLRYGAHSLSCPVYRESRDPVDRLNDDATRTHYRERAHGEEEHRLLLRENARYFARMISEAALGVSLTLED